MNRRHQLRNETACEVAFPLSLVDMLSVLLLCVIIAQATTKVTRQRLPGLRINEVAGAKPSDQRAGCAIAVLADGTVHYQGQPVAPDALVSRIGAEPVQDTPIVVSLEIDPKGGGALSKWLQLQADLTQAGLWGRVQVLTRNTPTQREGN